MPEMSDMKSRCTFFGAGVGLFVGATAGVWFPILAFMLAGVGLLLAFTHGKKWSSYE